jgi:phosphohistidine phosphatase
MRTVYLLRHAKSDWGETGMKDHDRPLNERGRNAAPKMADYIESKRYEPDLVLCSSARRTVETCHLIRSALGDDAVVNFEEDLYLAEETHLFERLRSLEDDVKSVMFIGHNPGMEQFANALAASPKRERDEKLNKRMGEKFSTCALAVIELPIEAWREAKPGMGKLRDFMRPKNL